MGNEELTDAERLRHIRKWCDKIARDLTHNPHAPDFEEPPTDEQLRPMFTHLLADFNRIRRIAGMNDTVLSDYGGEPS